MKTAFALVGMAVPASSSAQVPDAEATSSVSRPSKISGEAIYPPEGRGDAVVVLKLTISADGEVVEAEVHEGQEPFAGAALAAVKSFRFEPARRNGEAVGARILFSVAFEAPKTADASTTKGVVDAGKRPAKTAVSQAVNELKAAESAVSSPSNTIEVVVEGEQPAPMTTTMSREEVRQMPGAFGDPFRAIEAMPGVTPIASGVPYFFVRGAPPGNVGYFLDGIRVPLLYHVALGPSIVHPALIERVDLYPGGYPARFGRFTGGIVSGETKDPEFRLHGEGNVRLFDAGALLEAPYAKGRGSALVAGRYSYTGAMVSLFSPNVELGYWDYQFRATYDLTNRDRIGIFAFGSHDYLAEIEEDGDVDVVVAGDFHRVDLRYDTWLGDTGRLRQAVTFGYDDSSSRDGEQAGHAYLIGTRMELSQQVSKEATVRAGADAQVERYEIDVSEKDDDFPSLNDQALARLLTSREDLAAGVWADVALRPVPGFEVVPGIRSDVFTSDGKQAVTLDGRLASRLEVTRRVALLSAFGVTHQPPSFLGAVPGMQVGGLQGGVQTGLQASAGVEVKLPGDVMASVVGFRNAFFNLSDALGNRPLGNDDGLGRRAELRAMGTSHGVEVSVRRSLTKRLGGFLSYTLSKSVRHLGRETFDSAFDRRHVLNVAVSYDLGKNWKLGGRVVFYTGIPMTLDYDLWRRNGNGNGPGNDGPDTEEDILRREERRRLVAAYVRSLDLPERLPSFFRLDARLEKRWIFDGGQWLSLTFELLNATASKETLQYECSIEEGCVPEELGPVVIPSIGLEGGF